MFWNTGIHFINLLRVVFRAITSYFLLKGNNLTFFHLLLLAVSASLIIAI